jgi:4-hydroxybenzoyl-CoA reductase subunit alpha
MEGYSVIGKRLPRVDAKEKVTGGAKYAADYSLPGMLWCKLLRSPYPHARILSIDTSRAEKLRGVRGVVTGKDFGGWTWGWMLTTRDEPPLAVDKVRYLAEAVAGVAAIDEDIAEEATELIKVDYEELPGVFDPEEAMKEGAPKVHDYVKNNISAEYHWNFGDVEKAFAQSYIVREDKFRTSRATKGYLEPPAILACYDPAGYITVWAAKQSPYFLYRHLAACFKLPLSKVRIVQPFIGGGFGGTKNDSLAGDFCSVLLSKMAGKPVKYVESQEEELMTSRRRHNMIVYSRMGVNKDGTLTAIHHRVIADGGGYTAIGPMSLYLAGIATTLPYKLPNFKYDGYRAFTNNPIQAAMRGHGITHTRFAAEIQMDMIAEELRIDPVEIRMRNAIEKPKPGTIYETINKVTLKTCGLKEAIQEVSEDPIWRDRDKMSKKEGDVSWGVGLSCAPYLGGARLLGHQSCAATVRICEDGTVNLITGATDCGQGSDTVLCMIAAEELGINVKDIELKRVDTAYTPVDPGSWGSRVTLLAGQAAQIAAREAKRKLLEVAAKEWQVKPEEIEIRGGKAFIKSDPGRSIPFERLARMACYSGTGAVILGTGYSGYGLEPSGLTSGFGNPGISYSFTAQSAKVGVDLETGKIIVTDFTIASDCGRLLSPITAEGQIEGASIQGLGQTLYEDFIMDRGKTLNPTFLDYKMPLSMDVPNIKLIDIVTDDPDGPFGAKEASEGSIVSAPPAIVSAIHNATGVWMKELPVTPERIWRALKEKPGDKK